MGNCSKEPSDLRLYWIKTRFQISITCGCPLFTSSCPGIFFLSSSSLISTWISEHGPHGPVSPISQKLSFFDPSRIRFSGSKALFPSDHKLHDRVLHNSASSPSKIVAYNRSSGNFKFFSKKFPCPFNSLFFKIITK